MNLMPLTHNIFYLEAIFTNESESVSHSVVSKSVKKNRFNANKGEAAWVQSIHYF